MSTQCEHGQLRRTCDMCERDEQIADLTARLAEAERDRDAALDKALKYDIDACGIELRNQEAVELIEMRAEVVRMRETIAEILGNKSRIKRQVDWAHLPKSVTQGMD